MTTAAAKTGTLLKFAKPKATLTRITPTMAAKWLQDNGKNRNIRPGTVDAYARDIANGDWQVTGDAIKFALDGTMLDGQHRLSAIVQADTPVDMFVIRGLTHDAQTVMDSGVKRTASDALSLREFQNTNLLASVARMGLTVDTIGYAGIVGKQRAFTTTEIATYIDDHPELPEFLNAGAKAARQMDASPTVVCYAMWRLTRINPDAASDFFTAAAEGVGLLAGDPVLALRRRLAEARRNRERLSMAAYLSMIFRAWNARQEGKPIQRMQVSNRFGEITIPEPVA